MTVELAGHNVTGGYLDVTETQDVQQEGHL